MNDQDSLPRFILVVPDWDLLKYFGAKACRFGISDISFKILKWMANNIDRVIECRKEDLSRIKPGVISPAEPKIIWVKMINRVEVTARVLAVRNKFNQAMADMVADRKSHFILDPNSVVEDSSLISAIHGTLNAEGHIRYWKKIDELIEKFDYKEVSLKPDRVRVPQLGQKCYSSHKKFFFPNKVCHPNMHH